MDSINDISGLGKPIAKFMDTIRDFTSLITDPLKMKRMTTAEVDRTKRLGDAQLDQQIKAKKELAKTDREIGTENINHIESLLFKAQQRFLHDEIDNQNNIDNVVEKTIKYLPENVSDEPVDKDWKKRFFNKVKDISDDDVQDLWAKILAGEVSQPNSFSYRTLDILHNLTKNEAIIFEKIAKLSIDGKVWANDLEFFSGELGINFSDIIIMNDIGLLSIISNLAISTKNIKKGDKRKLIFNDKLILIEFLTDLNEFQIPCLNLTTSGFELSKLIEKNYPENYIEHVAKLIKKIDHQNVIKIFDIIERNGKEVKFDEKKFVEI